MADRIEWAPRWWPCASAAATLAPRRRPRRQHVRVVRRRPRPRREHVLARASTRPSSAPRIDDCAASGHLAHVARGRTQHCASTAAATTIAHTRCRQRPHLGAAAPVALCRRRRHHMGVGRRWQPPQGPQCSPDRAHVGRVAPGASTDASHGDGRRLDNRPQLVDAEAVDPHRHSGTMAPHRQPRCPPVHVARRRPPHRRAHGLTRARARRAGHLHRWRRRRWPFGRPRPAGAPGTARRRQAPRWSRALGVVKCTHPGAATPTVCRCRRRRYGRVGRRRQPPQG